ncbi:MAG TPA: hypothetical protein P5054_08065, partial [Desulfomonilia bacterium]|nr:hypothetical protein [Desulfomonilia bacterium]
MYQKKSITLKSIGFTIVFALVFMCVPLHAAVYYVSPGGTRTSGASTEGNWTNSNCYGTISAAIQRMSGGDEVVVNDGTYTGLNNVIGRYNSINIPSGTAS